MLKYLSMAKAVIELKKNPAIRLFDVRTPDEYRSGHLPNAVNLPLQRIRDITRLVLAKNTPIYVYCAHGIRAEQAGLYLVQFGYLDVTTIGGIADYSGPQEY